MRDLSTFHQASAGHPAAIEDISDALRPRLQKMAAFYARCTGEDADDLLQEAWLGLLEALPALDTSIGSAEHYLLAHARWRLLDAVRRARTRRCLSLESLNGSDETETLSPDFILRDWSPARANLAAFAAQLKSTQRAVLFCLLRGDTWREAGAALGCTSANIAYHVRQIQCRYREWSEEHGESTMSS